MIVKISNVHTLFRSIINGGEAYFSRREQFKFTRMKIKVGRSYHVESLFFATLVRVWYIIRLKGYRACCLFVAANNETGSYRGEAYTPLSTVSQKILVTQIINRMENLTRIPRPLSMARDRFALFAATRSPVKRCHVCTCVCIYVCVCAFDCSTWFCIAKTAILSIILPRDEHSASFLIIVTLINFQESFNGSR